ncbi:MAG: hypothetical protein AAF579_19920 [Cyanobacteria bacterium P01_C01_bin.118]
MSRPPVIPALFAQFRHQYADGSLTTELLTTHAEQYLVKATVTIADRVLATALASAPDLAAADDQAKARVLAMLGVDQGTEIPAEVAELKPPAIAAPKPEPSPPSVAPLQSDEETVVAIEANGVAGIIDDDMGRPLDSFDPEEAPAPAEVPASSLAAAALRDFDDSNPVDLSDIIAQTDVEMTRLGWSSIQGRQYLEKTFSKRSRQQLTDEELLTFLLYLESQATPSMS